MGQCAEGNCAGSRLKSMFHLPSVYQLVRSCYIAFLSVALNSMHQFLQSEYFVIEFRQAWPCLPPRVYMNENFVFSLRVKYICKQSNKYYGNRAGIWDGVRCYNRRCKICILDKICAQIATGGTSATGGCLMSSSRRMRSSSLISTPANDRLFTRRVSSSRFFSHKCRSLTQSLA